MNALVAPVILLVDDDPTQRKLNALRLADAGFAVDVAADAEEAMRCAWERRPDVVASDVLMPDVDGFALCRRFRGDPQLAGVPVVLLTSHFREEIDQRRAQQVGASALVSRTSDFGAELTALREAVAFGAPPMGVEPTTVTHYEEHLRSSANQLAAMAEEVRSSRVWRQLLFENTSTLVSIVSLDGTVLDANPRWRDVLGLAPAQINGRPFTDFVAPGHGPAAVELFHALLAGRPRGQAPLQHADGHLVWVEFSANTLEAEGHTVLIAMGQDITERVRAEEELAAAHEQYRSLVERLPDVVWTARADGRLSFITPNAAHVLGYSPARMIAAESSFWTDGVHPDDLERVVAAHAQMLTTGTLFDLEHRRRRADGTWIWVWQRAISSYEKNGVRYFDGLTSDVTERRNLEEGLRQVQKMEAIGQLTGGIAHDFNNMLSAILVNSHFLLDALPTGDPRREDAEEIRRATERAATLTRQLLAFSRRQVLEPRSIDLNSTVAGVEKMLRRMLGEDIALTTSCTPDLGVVRADVGQIEQVLLNMVVNARDAMPTGGTLTVETANVELSGDYIPSHPPIVAGRYVMLAISDNGCGMDAETQRRAFEPFFTTKALGKGTGLGLSTCYGIIKQSRGFIWIYSEPGHGTTFKIYLPRVDEVAAPIPETAVADTAASAGEQVLVVEDDAGLREAIRRILQARGYKVFVASNGEEALAAIARQENPIDLVLSDVVMPGGCGPEVVTHVLERSPSTRALFMSGYTDHAALHNGVLEGGMAFLQKPFSPDVLAKKVREVLDA